MVIRSLLIYNCLKGISCVCILNDIMGSACQTYIFDFAVEYNNRTNITTGQGERYFLQTESMPSFFQNTLLVSAKMP